MKVGIHTHYKGLVGPFSKKYIKIFEENKIDFVILDINELDFWEKLKSCTHFIYHWGGYSDQYQIAHTILPIIEAHLHIKCFPNYSTYFHHDDKIRQYYLLKNKGYPIIDSWIFWGKNKALDWLRIYADYPLVFKLKSSAGSKDVVLVNNYSHAKKICKKIFGKGIYLGKVPGNIRIKIIDFSFKKYIDSLMKKIYRIIQNRDTNYQWDIEKNYVLFQKYLPGNDFDTRVTIIGNRAFAFRRFNRKNDFRSSGSGLINYEMDKINRDFIKLAFKISNEFGFQSMAYDFLYDKHNKPSICEISYTYQDLAVYNCPGYWDVDLKWHEGHFWPQYFHMINFLNINNLTQPIFEY